MSGPTQKDFEESIEKSRKERKECLESSSLTAVEMMLAEQLHKDIAGVIKEFHEDYPDGVRPDEIIETALAMIVLAQKNARAMSERFFPKEAGNVGESDQT